MALSNWEKGWGFMVVVSWQMMEQISLPELASMMVTPPSLIVSMSWWAPFFKKTILEARSNPCSWKAITWRLLDCSSCWNLDFSWDIWRRLLCDAWDLLQKAAILVPKEDNGQRWRKGLQGITPSIMIRLCNPAAVSQDTWAPCCSENSLRQASILITETGWQNWTKI